MGRMARTEPQCLYRGALYLFFCYIFDGLHSVVRVNDVMKRTQAQLCLTLYL